MLVQLSNIVKNYGKGEVVTKVLQGINLEIRKGDFIAIMGPSGSGKTTLLNIIGLLDRPTGGSYILNNRQVSKLSQDALSGIRNIEIGFVFQSFNLLKRLSVLENIILPAIYKGVSKKEREEKAKSLLTLVGLKDQIHKKPNQLSGGQQQRVAIARSLMNNPSIILADEPTGNLDTKSGEEIMTILKDLNKQGNTIIMITHEHDIARQAKKIIALKDGKII